MKMEPQKPQKYRLRDSERLLGYKGERKDQNKIYYNRFWMESRFFLSHSKNDA